MPLVAEHPGADLTEKNTTNNPGNPGNPGNPENPENPGNPGNPEVNCQWCMSMK
jgi:hypothetical protein